MDHIRPSREPGSDAAPGPLSFADVIARLQANPHLKPARCREMASALRTFARLLNLNPADVAADPQTLRDQFARVTRATGGFSKSRWSNLRSLIRAALRVADVTVMPGRSTTPLTPEWQALRGQLPDARFRHGLSRAMSFWSARQIPPGAVGEGEFQRFRQALETDSLVKNPHEVFRVTCQLWNRAAAGLIEGWPGLLVEVPTASRRWALSWGAFPVSFRAEVDAFLDHGGNPNPFAKDYRKPVKPRTTEVRRVQLQHVASCLVGTGFPAENLTSLAVLVQWDNATRALEAFYERTGQSSNYLHQLAHLLGTIAKYWLKADPDQVEALRKLSGDLRVKVDGMTAKNKDRLRQFDDAENVDTLLALTARVLRDTRRDDRGTRRDALQVMRALAVELLLLAPMRIDNLAGLEIERHFVRSGRAGILHVVIPAGPETKTGAPYEVELPKSVTDLMAVYIRDYRPRLCAGPSPWLFPNEEGERRCTVSFATSLSAFIQRETGLLVNMHLFRSLAVKFHLEANPEDIETARRLLGHKNQATTLKYYADIKSAAAFRSHAALITSRRDAAGRLPRGRGAR